MNQTNNAYVLDTNVILTDSDVLDTFASRDIFLPEVVFQEVDKIKMGRADSDTRYKGREFTRQIFELSEGKPLTEGIELAEGGILTVVPFDSQIAMPEGFAARNPDDRIIVTAQRLQEEFNEKAEEEGTQPRNVILVTSDLNMLIKAQSLGVNTNHHEDELNQSFTRKWIIRPFQKYRTPLTILGIAIAIFIATLLVTFYNTNILSQQKTAATIPSEYRTFLTSEQAQIVDSLITLQTNPDDAASLITVGNGYLTMYNETVTQDPATAITYANRGVEYYTRALKQEPQNHQTRTNLGILLFYSGESDNAIKELKTVLDDNPDDLLANYYLGIVQLQGQGDIQMAKECFKKAIHLAGNDEANQEIKQSAEEYLDQINSEEEKLANPSADGIVL